MIGLFIELIGWAIKLTVLLFVLMVQAIAALYRATERAVHGHRLRTDPQASREGSQLIAGSIVAGLLGLLVLIGSLTDNSEKPAAANSSSSSPSAFEASASTDDPVEDETAGTAADEAAAARKARARRAARCRAARQRVARREARRRAERRRRARLAALAEPTPDETPASDGCDPNYSGECLNADSSDYDCEGGSGDGPDFVGIVQVEGDDHFDLDRDGDGTACDT